MKQITLNIPETKLQFFVELAKQLGFEISQEKTVDFTVPEWQKEEIDKALEDHKKGLSSYSDWSKTKKALFAKYAVE